jgi:hypothetical protein
MISLRSRRIWENNIKIDITINDARRLQFINNTPYKGHVTGPCQQDNAHSKATDDGGNINYSSD